MWATWVNGTVLTYQSWFSVSFAWDTLRPLWAEWEQSGHPPKSHHKDTSQHYGNLIFPLFKGKNETDINLEVSKLKSAFRRCCIWGQILMYQFMCYSCKSWKFFVSIGHHYFPFSCGNKTVKIYLFSTEEVPWGTDFHCSRPTRWLEANSKAPMVLRIHPTISSALKQAAEKDEQHAERQTLNRGSPSTPWIPGGGEMKVFLLPFCTGRRPSSPAVCRQCVLTWGSKPGTVCFALSHGTWSRAWGLS